MNLRMKFGLLALGYVVSLTANVALCAWCITEYYEALLGRYAEAAPVGATLSLLRPHAAQAYADASSTEQPAHPSTGQPATATPDVVEQIDLRARLLRILLLDAAIALSIGLLGLRLVRRWVLIPVKQLRRAAAQIAGGNFSHRVPHVSRDELGLLARQVDDMAATITRMQAEVLDQERNTARGQTLTCVIHNIRSPLLGIRWLAEVIAMRPATAPDVARTQEDIVRRVDDLLLWLQEFRRSLPAADADASEIEHPAIQRPMQVVATEGSSHG